ncbi:MAG: HRDC domain-containing protein [Kiritimatiellae bacterium]|nr:HRDC domain-containing protein [Kiritimatiellia bacterium]
MSQFAVFFIPLQDNGAFQGELNAFLRGHRVLQVEKTFTGNGWSFCVEWLEGSTSAGFEKTRRIDYRETLEPEVFERFAKLRERRKAIAQEDGVPPYMVMTDAQMAEAVKDAYPTLETLRGLTGFGAGRFEKYGERLCPIMDGTPPCVSGTESE